MGNKEWLEMVKREAEKADINGIIITDTDVLVLGDYPSITLKDIIMKLPPTRDEFSSRTVTLPDERFTFKDLHDMIDFSSEYNFKHLKGSEWGIEISTYNGENIKLCRTIYKDSNFFTVLEIYFDGDNIELYPGDKFRSHRFDAKVNCTHINSDTYIDGKDDVWYAELFADRSIGLEMVDFINKFINALKTSEGVEK